MLSRATQNSAITLSRCIRLRSNVLLRTKHTRSTPNVKLVNDKRYFTNTITKPRQIPQNKTLKTTTASVNHNEVIQEEQDPIPVEETNDIVADLEALSESKDINNKKLSTQSMILLGDFVEIFHNGQYSGVVVGQRKSSGGRQVLTVLLRNGKTKDFSSTVVAHVVPKFIQSDTRLSKFKFDSSAESLPDDYPIASFTRGVMDYQRTIQLRKGIQLKRFTQLYDQFTDKRTGNSHNTNNVSLDILTQFAFGPTVTEVERHATFLYLMNDNIHFIPTTNVRQTGLWILRDKKETEIITQIIESVRSKNDDFNQFLKRAKQLVEFHKEHADPILGTISQSSLDKIYNSKEYGLSDTDAMFVNFIADWIKSPPTGIHTPHEIFAPTILKALGCYDDHLFVDRKLAMLFLKQVGMFKPWDNAKLIQNANNVIDDYIWSDKAKKMDQTMNLHSNLFLKGKLDKSGFYLRDPCDAIRHDFGDMPVYTIDDQAAKEIDDGISIERIPGSDSMWLHVHIADPSAYIPPTHALAKVMEQRGQSLYLPESHHPILPNALASQKFSLGDTAHTVNSNGSQYALTFSCKLNKEDGNVQAWKLQPSLVKNVKKLYYNDVDQFLKPYATSTIPHEPLVNFDKKYEHPLQHTTTTTTAEDQQILSSSSKTSTVSKEFEQDLLDIFKLTSQHSQFRFQNGALNFVRPNPYVELEPQPLELPNIHFTPWSSSSSSSSSSLLPNYASTLPTIRIGLDNSTVSPAKKMVAEAMILGGRIASHFAQEHGIDIPHRRQMWPSDETISNQDITQRLEMLNERNPNTGTIGLSNVIQYMGILPPVSMTTTPGLPHVLMGIPNGYVKATSPLRRYLDIVTHWQIKAHLLKQKAPFTRERLDQQLLPRMEIREKQLSFLQQDCLQFWVIELMNRFMGEGKGNMEWTCLVNLPNMLARSELGGTMEVARVTILELGLKARIQNLKQSLQIGQVVNARIVKLDSFNGFVELELV
ncbi:hypothetical protein INT45_000850 [Circinella minor]|uniref:RNB domain-containing protein n=1 Tax=Circinella minor TaxID=1195481 RepID=A0A8H7S7G2_9FUNG|nr:hypothetical protein INT45_000850 [Circinella minor]